MLSYAVVSPMCGRALSPRCESNYHSDNSKAERTSRAKLLAYEVIVGVSHMFALGRNNYVCTSSERNE
jgi:hypothetical protein